LRANLRWPDGGGALARRLLPGESSTDCARCEGENMTGMMVRRTLYEIALGVALIGAMALAAAPIFS